MSLIHLSLDAYLAAVLLVAGLSKLGDPKSFVAALHHQGVFPTTGIPAVTLFLPPFQIGLAFVLLVGLYGLSCQPWRHWDFSQRFCCSNSYCF